MKSISTSPLIDAHYIETCLVGFERRAERIFRVARSLQAVNDNHSRRGRFFCLPPAMGEHLRVSRNLKEARLAYLFNNLGRKIAGQEVARHCHKMTVLKPWVRMKF